jgi:deoxyribonuclease V
MDVPFSAIEDQGKLSREEAEELQLKLAFQVRIERLVGPVSTICGVDCAYSRDDSRIYAAAILLSTSDLSVLATADVVRECAFPYLPGLLGFREGPASVRAIRALSTVPDIVMCDGHGVAHPRGFGLASLVGLWLDTPAIGVAKRRLCGVFSEPGPVRGELSPMIASRLPTGNEERIGTALRTRTGKKPLFVSPGHRISHEQAVDWVLRMVKDSRMPEPLRLAHQLAQRLRNEGEQGSSSGAR